MEKDVLITINTPYGDMKAILFEETPLHKKNFITLTKEEKFNSTIFHRVIKDFMIQGGDVNLKGDPNAIDYTIPAEFNDIKHSPGILSMARSTDPNSGGSQFFICAARAEHLDRNYTVFGQVVQGNQIIDKIVNLPRDRRDNPNRRVEMRIRLEKRDK